jgi:predicted nucleotidyltransferase
MTIHFTKQASAFISALAALQPPPDSIWLIGSRANGRATQESDTDLIVFGSKALLDIIRSQLKQPEEVDCLVVFNGDDYQDPWQEKTGSLTKLQWLKLDASSARYVGTKWVPDEESSLECGADMGNFLHRQERAIRLWP